jgi:hypothetical protein
MDNLILFDFNSTTNINKWRIIDDGVMGGISSGNFKIDSDGNGVFYGTVSLENNGGFSSVRHQMNKTKIKEFSKFVIRLKGDGKDYQFRIKDQVSNYFSYSTTFSTSGEWQEIEIDIKGLYPSFRGRVLDLPNFNSEYIEEMVFLIGNKKYESFKLVIDKIELKE